MGESALLSHGRSGRRSRGRARRAKKSPEGTETDTNHEGSGRRSRGRARRAKKRVAAPLVVSIQTADIERMNNPVSRSRLIEMYRRLRLIQWPKIKQQLKLHITRDHTEWLIQTLFKEAAAEMDRKKELVEEMFGLTGTTQVEEYKESTLQNLQMALFHTRKEDLLETCKIRPSNEDLRPLASECFWLGCLMALSNPSLQPDWENHTPGMDPWDFFPQDIKSSVM
ncbi:uncharacterized protein LOC114453891 isoform X2 [Parambassis ranga]|uniref:Uncharacterized protein LOC114453891 isoform X2 n=1 Tax=Parambassis ranga TaxID=210632 RepID=A0A6P7KQE7_9TELE|nr:uncharacterized protein LOC114453891 isoform X2 [Parambassis ranga]